MATGGLPGTLEPLCFQLSPQNASLPVDHVLSASCVPCILCNETFSGEQQISAHLLASHKIIVKDLQNITDLSRYMKYWKDRVNGGLQLNEFCLIVRTNSPDKQEFHFVLSDELAEDRELRTRIKTEKLEEVLIQQQKERFDDSFSRSCLFCTKLFTGNREKLFAHMAQFHNFDVGDVDNLVYTTQLLLLLDQKLHNLQCLYCEKTFKDGPVLKEHMRKKRHKRLRRNNPVYRRFYVTSYAGANVADTDELDVSNNDEDSEEDDDDEDDLTREQSALQNEREWNDWVEKTEEFDAVCLFCHHTSADTESLLLHLQAVHGFDLRGLITAHNLTFYQQVKLINFMRRQFHYNVCTFCDEKFENYEALAKHLTSTSHSSELPPATSWNQPQYYFPTYENDSLLCSLVDIESDVQSDEVNSEMLQVIAEDLPECVNKLTLQINTDKRSDINYVN